MPLAVALREKPGSRRPARPRASRLRPRTRVRPVPSVTIQLHAGWRAALIISKARESDARSGRRELRTGTGAVAKRHPPGRGRYAWTLCRGARLAGLAQLPARLWPDRSLRERAGGDADHRQTHERRRRGPARLRTENELECLLSV